MHLAGLINFNKQGRLKLLSLTKKGQEVVEHIDQIRNAL
jgi:predicted transcriptional regulator